MSANTSMYGYNPYAFNPYSTGLNNDFMYNATGGYNQLAQQQALIQGYQQPQTDTFQKSGVGIGGLGLLAGGGAATGVYHFGTNPIKNGKVAEGLIKSVNSTRVAEQQAIEYNNLLNGRTNVSAKDRAKLYQQAVEKANAVDLNLQNQRLSNLQAGQNILKELGKNPTAKELKELVKAHPEQFGLSGKTEKELNKAVNEFLKSNKAKSDISKYLNSEIKKQKATVKNLNKQLEQTVKGYLDKLGKVKANAPESFTKAVKNFKWKTAGKWGAIAAGAGLLLGYLFGGNKS